MSSESKYRKQVLSGIGTGMQDKLIEGAYLSARAGAPDYSWMNVIGSGIKSFKEEIDSFKAEKQANRDNAIAGIKEYVNTIYDTGGSLPQEYFDQAYDYTEKLRQEYIAAIDSGDTKKQHQLKAQLNAFSTSIQTTKESLSEGGALWNDDMLVNNGNGLTDHQISVNKSMTGKNAVLVDGEFKWKAIDENGQPILENGEQKYYTMEDYKNALPLKDNVTIEAYLDSNKSILEKGEDFRNGKGSDFDFSTNKKANITLLDKSIQQNGNLQSMILDDITGQGSFASSLKDNPNFASIFDVINNKDGLKNVAAIGLYDQNGDGTVDFRDYMSEKAMQAYGIEEGWDKDYNEIIDETERKAMMEELNGPNGLEYVMTFMETNNEFKSEIETMAQENLSNAILDISNTNYNEDITKDLIAVFMTNRQRQMFYGQETVEFNGKQVPKYTLMVPFVDGSRVTMKGGKKSKGWRTMTIDGAEIDSLEDYVEAGGNYGYLKSQGYKWNQDKKKFLYVPPNEWSHSGAKYDGIK